MTKADLEAARASAWVTGLYEENAGAWDRGRGRDLHERRWLEKFAALMPAGGRLLDLGCGSGEPIARWFDALGFAITGIDSSPALIALCRERMPGQAWRVGDMRGLALGEQFDGILAWHSFFHLVRGDQRAMFSRFAAHAAPGAPLMFTSGFEDGEAIGAWQGEPLYHASLAPGEYRALLAAHGFDLVEYRLRDPECGTSCVWLARRRQ